MKRLLLTLILLSPFFCRSASAASPPPNVLMIIVDDMNDWVGCLGGHPQVKTPHIDRLAKRGLLFTNAHVAAPVCNPSRVATLTGLRPSTTGIYGNETKWLAARNLLLAERSRKPGTGVIHGGERGFTATLTAIDAAKRGIYSHLRSISTSLPHVKSTQKKALQPLRP